MMLASAAAVAVSAVFAAGPVATLPLLTAPLIVVGALTLQPAYAVPVPAAFGAPQSVEDPGPAAGPAVAQAAPQPAVPLPQPLGSPVPVSAAPASLSAPASTWRVEVADMNVRRVIERWSRTAGMQVIYDASKDVDVGAAAAFSGTYEHALQQLLTAIEASEMPLRACLYANAVTRVIPRLQRCD